MRFLVVFACLWAFGFMWMPSTAQAQSKGADACVGIWKNGAGTGHIEVFKKDNKYFGRVHALKVPNDPDGKPRTDIKNPDEKLRSRPLIGLVNMRNFVYDGDNVWEDGRIYDPKNGKDYACKMTLTGPNTLEVRGYIGISLLGRTDVWTR